jgi:hypothetical protein
LEDTDRSIHADDTQSTNDLRTVGDLLRAQQELAVIVLPTVVEALEAARAEANAGRGCEVQITRVEEVEKAVLQHFGPDF